VYWEMGGSLGANLGGLRKRGGKPAFAEATAGGPFCCAQGRPFGCAQGKK
jgi:hypothetical protein